MRGVVAGFGLLLVVNAVALARTRPPAQGLRVRGVHHLFQSGRALAAMLVVVLLVALAGRVGARGRRGLAALGVLAVAAGAGALPDDLENFAGNALPGAPGLLVAGLVAAAAAAVVAAAWVGGRLGRTRLRWLAVGVAAAVLAVHPVALDRGYAGVHLFAAAGAVTLAAAALAGAPRPAWWSRAAGALPWAMAAALAGFAVVVPPSNALRLQMLAQQGDVVTPFLPAIGEGAAGAGEPPEAWLPWFRPRDAAPPVPPSAPPLVAGPPVVVLVTIDSLRADVLGSRAHDDRLPNLARLRDESVEFTQARAPGSQTATTLTALFAGKYYSQMYWSRGGGFSHIWPWADETVRFPQRLTDAGVATMHHASADWFDGPVGVVRGFAEDLYTRASAGRFTVSSEFFPQVLTWIEAHAAGPAFVYTHLLDAHHRARPRSRKAPAYERYIDNLAIADEQIGELRRTIARLGIEGRTVVIVSSDHGEAFGEHDTIHHQTTLYEELLRVPLIVHAPGAAPRKVEVPVGVIDLGPTILDLFGVATAGHEMGESLVGFLRGQDPAPTRPLAAEGRLKKALLFPDGCKAIVDDRNRTAEVYDLRADPNELVNLVDTDDPTALARVDVLRRFFAVHEHRRPGYEPPYRQ